MTADAIWKCISACIALFEYVSIFLIFSEFTDDEGIKWTREKRRPNISLMNHYNCTWKAKNNHFYRRTDVKVKGT